MTTDEKHAEKIVAMARFGCDHLPPHWNRNIASPQFAIMAAAAAMVVAESRRTRVRAVVWTLVVEALTTALLWGMLSE